MRVTVQFESSGESKLIVPYEFEQVAGFCCSFTDFGENSDKLPKFAFKTDPGVGLMMVEAIKTMTNLGGASPVRLGKIRASRCRIELHPEDVDEGKVMSSEVIESDEGVLLIDTQQAMPKLFGWLVPGVTSEQYECEGIQDWTWLLAVYMSKMEIALRTVHAKQIALTCCTQALREHMKWMAEADSNAAMMETAKSSAEGVHLLGKGVPKRMRRRGH